MANIQVADLSLSGSDLLLGEESFLSELSEEQANLPHGGVSPFLSLAVTAALVTKLVATIAMRVEVSGSLPSLVLND